MDTPVQRVESALTQMVRRIHRVELYRRNTSQRLERTAYQVLAKLFDQGPQRLSALAAVLELDMSTVSRQVRSLEDSGLLVREVDPSDRRASILRLTAAGSEAMHRTRRLRRGVMRNVLSSWPSEDVATFADLLERFGADWRETDVEALMRDFEKPGHEFADDHDDTRE